MWEILLKTYGVTNMFPLELVTALVFKVVGGFMSMKARKDEAFINALAQRQEGWQAARETTNKGLQITRRWIALSTVFFVICFPKIVAVMYPAIDVTVGYHEIQQGFLFFTDDVEKVKWVTAKGLTITPLDSHLLAAIIGLYFGDKAGR